MATDVRIYRIQTSSVANLNNAQVAFETSADADLSYKMFVAKNVDGVQLKFLNKDQPIQVGNANFSEYLRHTGETDNNIRFQAGQCSFGTVSTDIDYIFYGNSATPALTITGSDISSSFGGNISVNNKVQRYGDSDNYISLNATSTDIYLDGLRYGLFGKTQFYYGIPSTDIDYYFYTNQLDPCLYIDGGDSYAQINGKFSISQAPNSSWPAYSVTGLNSLIDMDVQDTGIDSNGSIFGFDNGFYFSEGTYYDGANWKASTTLPAGRLSLEKGLLTVSLSTGTGAADRTITFDDKFNMTHSSVNFNSSQDDSYAYTINVASDQQFNLSRAAYEGLRFYDNGNDTNDFELRFYKQKNSGDIDSNTDLGTIRFYGYVSSSYTEYAGIRANYTLPNGSTEGLLLYGGDLATPDNKIDIKQGLTGIYLTAGSHEVSITSSELRVEGGILRLKETTTPTASTGYGKIYTKADDTLYFQDGAGVEHTLLIADYAGMSADDNSTATTITTQYVYTKIDIFDRDMPETVSNGDYTNGRITIGATKVYDVDVSISGYNSSGTNLTYEWDVFQIAASGTSITNISSANPGVVSASGHPFINGDLVKITGVTGMTEVNDQIFVAAGVSAGVSFQLNDTNGSGVDTTGFTAYSTGGTAILATKVNTHTHRKHATTDIGSMGDCANHETLTGSDYIELYVQNISGTQNIVAEHVSLSITRKN